MTGLPVDRMPPTIRSLGEAVARLRREISDLRAARRISAAVELEPWVDLNPALANGWTPAGGTLQSPVARRQVDGSVQLAGSLIPGTLTAGTVIATLDPAHCPSQDLEFRVGGGASTALVDLVVTAGGAITIQATAGTVVRISLTQICLPL